jgi:predicted transcriptional regulator of viral defense system
MRQLEEIKQLFAEHGGLLRTSDFSHARIFYKDIQALIEQGLIEKIRTGYYQWIDQDSLSEIVTINRLFPDAILCMETALHYYGFSDRTPLRWSLAVSKDSPKSRFKIDYPFVKPYYVESALLELGLTTGSIDSFTVRIYDKERVICDCLRYINKMDKEIFSNAIRFFVDDPQKDIPRLIQYAKRLRVQSKVKNLIGVWI